MSEKTPHPRAPIDQYAHLFRKGRSKRLFDYAALRSAPCNPRYAKLVHKTDACPFDLRARNAYFFLRRKPAACNRDKLYREPRNACTARPFPRLESFDGGYVEVMRFGRAADARPHPRAPTYTFYYAAPATTALYLKLENALVATTKLHALLLLGWDFRRRLKSGSAHPGDRYLFSQVLAKTQNRRAFMAEVDRLTELMRRGGHYSAVVGTAYFDYYDFDLIDAARARGHDAVVLLREPYSASETATEIIHLFPPHTSLAMLVERAPVSKRHATDQ